MLKSGRKMIQYLIDGRKIAFRWRALSRIPLIATGLFWLGAAALGMLLLMRYANSAGPDINPPEHWPQSSDVPHDTHRPTLAMFIHPHCPCSRATIGELALLMSRCKDRAEAHVFFLRPVQMPPNWAQTDLWREAARIPGVIVHQDDGGREARLFGAETSGDTVLYDTNGQLLFHGGITSSRGHSGDNTGRGALASLLLHEPVRRNSTPTFGCSLFDCTTNGAL